MSDSTSLTTNGEDVDTKIEATDVDSDTDINTSDNQADLNTLSMMSQADQQVRFLSIYMVHLPDNRHRHQNSPGTIQQRIYRHFTPGMLRTHPRRPQISIFFTNFPR
jgi:hypothetical protein